MKVFSCKNGVINLLELWRIKGLYDEEHCSSKVIVLGVIRGKKGIREHPPQECYKEYRLCGIFEFVQC